MSTSSNCGFRKSSLAPRQHPDQQDHVGKLTAEMEQLVRDEAEFTCALAEVDQAMHKEFGGGESK